MNTDWNTDKDEFNFLVFIRVSSEFIRGQKIFEFSLKFAPLIAEWG